MYNTYSGLIATSPEFVIESCRPLPRHFSSKMWRFAKCTQHVAKAQLGDHKANCRLGPGAHYGGIRGLDPLGVDPLVAATRFEGRNLGETVV